MSNYTAWWQRHTVVSILPKAITQWCPARTRNPRRVNRKPVALPIASPRHPNTNTTIVNFMMQGGDWLVLGSSAGDCVDLGSQRPADLCSSRLWRADCHRTEASCFAAAALWTTHSAATHRWIQHLATAAAQQATGCHHRTFHSDHQGTRLVQFCHLMSLPSSSLTGWETSAIAYSLCRCWGPFNSGVVCFFPQGHRSLWVCDD